MTTRAIVLDVDGTLVDSNRAHAYAWLDALAEAGLRVEFPQVLRLIGMGGDKLLPRVTGGVRPESALGCRVLERRASIFIDRYLPGLRPTRGARELLRRLHQDGFRLVVASSAKRGELEGLLAIAGAKDLVEQAVASDDAENSKPDPDIVEAAVRRANVGPDEAVMVGDTPYDIDAAHRTGVRVVALRCGGWDDTALRDADVIYEDPADLLARYREWIDPPTPASGSDASVSGSTSG
jgi:HAD superfamily hydrolase (TIGR01509 family)